MLNMEINIVTFIHPHLFFVTECNSEHRSDVLKDISNKIQKSHASLQDVSSFDIDEMVAVYQDHDLVRATIEDLDIDENSNKKTFFCWLIDYGTLIQTDKVFKLPKDVQKVPPQAKQACLRNICYLKEIFDLGVTGTIKSVPSLIPSSGVCKYTLDLLSGCNKIVLDVSESSNNILVGEVFIYKDGKVLSLSKELCDKGLITIDEKNFQRIKNTTKVYMKTHIEMIHQICNIQKLQPPTNLCKMDNADFDVEELSPKPLENGRRRNLSRKGGLNSSTGTSGSEDENHCTALLKNAKELNKKKPESPHDLKGLEESPEFEPKLNTSQEILEILDNIDSDSTGNSSAPSKEKGSPVHTSKENGCSPQSQQSESRSPVSKVTALLQKLKEKKAAKEEEIINAREEGTVKERVDVRKRLAELRAKKRNNSSSGSVKSDEGMLK